MKFYADILGILETRAGELAGFKPAKGDMRAGPVAHRQIAIVKLCVLGAGIFKLGFKSAIVTLLIYPHFKFGYVRLKTVIT